MNIQVLQIQLIALTMYQAMEKSRNCCQMIATDLENRLISSFPGIHGPTESLCLTALINGDVYFGLEKDQLLPNYGANPDSNMNNADEASSSRFINPTPTMIHNTLLENEVFLRRFSQNRYRKTWQRNG